MTKASGVLSPSYSSKLRTQSTIPKVRTPSPSRNKKEQYKGELTQMISEQLEMYSKKIEMLILQKVTYEIPLQTRIHEDNIKNDIKSLISFRVNSISKSLRTYFNLKLKFCLNKAGYDTNTLDIKPFLDNDDDYFEIGLGGLEIIENEASNDRHDIESNDMQAIANEIKRIESSIYNHKISVEPYHDDNFGHRSYSGSFNLSNTSPHSKCDHLAFHNNNQVKSEVVEYLQDEIKNTTNNIMKYQSNKMTETFREANHQFQSKLTQDINNVLDNLEERFKTKFEEIIDIKTSQLLDILGHPQKISPHRKKASISPKNLTTLTASTIGNSSGSNKDYKTFSPSRISTHKMQIQNELEQIQDDINFNKINQDSNNIIPLASEAGLKIPPSFDIHNSNTGNDFIANSEPSLQGTFTQSQNLINTNKLRNSQDVRQKINLLKNSLNFLDEGERSISQRNKKL